MKTILSLRRHHYLKTVGIFLIAVALIVGTVSCNGGATYKLTMAVAPTGSGMATDEKNTSPYAKDTVVDIKAVANPGYEFVKWTSSAGGTFANANDEETTFTMPAQDVIVTAHFVAVYDLTMAVNPMGGGTTTPTGTNPYPEDTEVDIQAVATPPYQFVKWTATAGTLDDENEAETTFTMPAEDVIVTANFVGPLDHATAYWVGEATPPYIEEEVYLEDQFCAVNAYMLETAGFVIPAVKGHDDVTTPIMNPDHCLTVYYISCEEEPQAWQVTVSNQFGTQNLTVEGPYGLAVPTQNGGHEAPVGLDHYLLYEVIDYTYLDEVSVELNDQFLEEPQVYGVYEPVIFANPVKKTHGSEVTEIMNPDVHAVIYMTDMGEVDETVEVVNQFGEQALEVNGPFGLVVPSEKISWEQPLDHFKCYSAGWEDAPPPTFPVDVQLEDQFIADWLGESLNATVYEPWLFANPTNKVKIVGEEEVWTPISDPRNHLTFYYIDYEEDPQVWEVTVNNQFGNDQVLLVVGPYYLAVPTQKEDHNWPADLDHFLVYDVIDWFGSYPGVPVFLWDQFGEQPAKVYEPAYFAVPVQKTIIDSGEVTEIKGDEHLVFYWIDGGEFDTVVPVDNQFGPQLLYVWQEEYDLLGVPSEKIDWEHLLP